MKKAQKIPDNQNGRIARNQDCFLATEALRILVQKEIPVATALKLRKMVKAIESHSDIVREQHQAILEQCAELNEDGSIYTDESGNFVIRPDAQEQYRAAYEELMLCEWKDAPQLLLDDLDGVKVKTETLLRLDAFLEG